MILGNYKNLLWDFDGVIMDSMPIRNNGFKLVLADYHPKDVALLMKYHMDNGGLSRYNKFRYFFENILGEQVSEQQIQKLAAEFSKIMLKRLLDESLLINDSVAFIKANYRKYQMHIVSGSDQNELRIICKELNLDKYFKSINGSPIPKNNLVKSLIVSENYQLNETCLIGDSMNDFEAAKINGINFFGYNSEQFNCESFNFIKSFKE
jgi:phosphoglycolate phosphatase-like HAD superfamily hydrolase